jgi:hypothetical protein
MGENLLTTFRLNVFLLLIITFFTNGALSDDNNTPPENIEGSILFNNKKDTIDTKDFLKDSTILPGDYKLNFSPFQDSAYYSALRLRLPATTRFYHDMKIFTGQWQFAPSDREATLEELANKSIQDLPDEYFMPSSTEKAMYEYNIASRFMFLMCRLISHLDSKYQWMLLADFWD